MKALCIGVHVLDVLVQPVEAIPEGDGAGLGTDHGEYDLAAAEALAAS